MQRLGALLSVVWPSAVMAATELALVCARGGSDRPYVARVAGMLALGQILAAAVIGLALAAWGTYRDSVRSQASLAAGIAVALGFLQILAYGAPPLFPAGAVDAAIAIGIATGVGAIMAVARFPLAPPGPPAGILFVPTLAGPLLLASWQGARELRIPPSSLLGAAILAAGLLAGLGLGVALERIAALANARVARGLLVAGSLAGVLAALVAISLGRPLHPNVSERIGEAPDVLLVVLDTARADRVPAPAGAPFATPALDRVVREGTTWTHAFSTSCWTLPAHASLFTGLEAADHGCGWERPALDPTLPTLASRLRDAGWRTGGFSANPWISREFGFDRDFDRFVEGNAARLPRRPWASAFLLGRWDGLFEDKRGATLASEALRFLDGSDGRASFVFLNLLEPHLPYAPPRRWLDRAAADGWDRDELLAIDQDRLKDLLPGSSRSPREIEGLERLYAAEIAYADSILGEVLRRLEESGRLDRTLLVVTSDHGENLGDHPPLDHQLALWDTLVRVPLVVRWPGRVASGSRRTGLVSLADLPEAVLTWTRGDSYAEPDRDHVLLDYDRPGHILDLVRERLGLDPSPWDRRIAAIRTENRKWIAGSDGRNEAYDLQTDSGELRDLSTLDAGVPPGFDDLARRLAAKRSAWLVDRTGVAPATVDPETLERLRSLGYVR